MGRGVFWIRRRLQLLTTGVNGMALSHPGRPTATGWGFSSDLWNDERFYFDWILWVPPRLSSLERHCIGWHRPNLGVWRKEVRYWQSLAEIKWQWWSRWRYCKTVDPTKACSLFGTSRLLNPTKQQQQQSYMGVPVKSITRAWGRGTPVGPEPGVSLSSRQPAHWGPLVDWADSISEFPFIWISTISDYQRSLFPLRKVEIATVAIANIPFAISTGLYLPQGNLMLW